MGLKKTYFLLLIAFTLLSFFNLQSERKTHYQEVDSVISYDLLQDKDAKIARYVSWSYKQRDWSDYKDIDKESETIFLLLDKIPNQIYKIIPETNSFRKIYSQINTNDDNYPTSAEETKQFIKVYLEKSGYKNLPLHGLYRIAISFITDELPRDLRIVMEYPLASTYTFGMGLYYAAISLFTEGFDEFKNISILINLILLHISLIMVYFTLVNFRFNYLTALVSTLTLMFSASLYSYAFHLGSTIHTYFAFVISLYFFSYYSNLNKKSLIALGIINSILLFHSYLIIIPLLAIYLMTFLHFFDYKYPMSAFRSFYKAISLQKISLILMSACVLIFYQPGQGIRGAARDISEFYEYFYLAIMNLTGWLDLENLYLNLFQFIFFLVLIIYGLYRLFNTFYRQVIYKKNADSKNRPHLGFSLILYSLFVYLFFLFAGLLSFAPTRHILFLQVFIVILYAFSLDRALIYLKDKYIMQVSMIIFTFTIGVISQNYRLDQTKEINFNYDELNDVGYLVSDMPTIFSKKTDIPVYYPSENFDTAQDYYYISKTTALEMLSEENKESLGINNRKVSVILENDDMYSFMPFSSHKFEDGRFAFNRGNGLYIYKISNSF